MHFTRVVITDTVKYKCIFLALLSSISRTEGFFSPVWKGIEIEMPWIFGCQRTFSVYRMLKKPTATSTVKGPIAKLRPPDGFLHVKDLPIHFQGIDCYCQCSETRSCVPLPALPALSVWQMWNWCSVGHKKKTAELWEDWPVLWKIL